jgi:hypothetical protein
MNRTSAQKRSAEKFKQHAFLFGTLANADRRLHSAIPPVEVPSIDEMDDTIASLQRKAAAKDLAE